MTWAPGRRLGFPNRSISFFSAMDESPTETISVALGWLPRRAAGCCLAWSSRATRHLRPRLLHWPTNLRAGGSNPSGRAIANSTGRSEFPICPFHFAPLRPEGFESKPAPSDQRGQTAMDGGGSRRGRPRSEGPDAPSARGRILPIPRRFRVRSLLSPVRPFHLRQCAQKDEKRARRRRASRSGEYCSGDASPSRRRRRGGIACMDARASRRGRPRSEDREVRTRGGG